MTIADAALSDTMRLVPTESAVLQRPAVALDAIGLAEYLTYFFGAILRERLGLRDRASGNQIGLVSLRDTFRLVSSLGQTREVALVESIGLQHLQQLQTAVRLIEKLQLLDALDPKAIYQLPLEESVRLVATLVRFFGGDIDEGMSFTDLVKVRQRSYPVFHDTIGLTGAVVPHLLMNVTTIDDVVVDDAQALRMLFQPTLHEGVLIEAGYLEPDGSLTTWAMNTRTGAVTEYANYGFNSFAQVGRRFFGASENGLYELLGDDDAGDDIVARIKGGYLQFGGTRLSRLKEAYIATTNDGRFVLRILTKDGSVYNYGIDARDGRSTKVHMGKGMRARYFAYELTSAGQDFDLDTLEFVPLVVQRRV